MISRRGRTTAQRHPGEVGHGGARDYVELTLEWRRGMGRRKRREGEAGGRVGRGESSQEAPQRLECTCSGRAPREARGIVLYSPGAQNGPPDAENGNKTPL